MVETFFFYLFGAGSPLSIFVINLSISVLFLFSIYKILSRKVKIDKVLIFFLVFILFQILSAILSEDTKLSFKGIRDYWALFGGFLAAYSLSKECIKKIDVFDMFLSIATTIATLMAVIETLFGTDFQRQRLFLNAPIGTMQAKGFFTHHLTFAGFVGLLFFYFFSLILKGKRRWFYYLGAISSIISLLLTQSRGYILIVILLLPFVLFRRSKRVVTVTAIAFLLILVLSIFFLPPRIKERATNLFSFKNGSFSERVYLLKSGCKMFLKHPVFGYGQNTYTKYSESFRKPYEEKIVYPDGIGFRTLCHTHNVYLMILIESGILGLVSYLVFLALLFESLIKIEDYHSLSFLFMLIFFLLGGLFEYNLGDAEVATLFSFMMGLSLSIKRNDREK